MSEENEATTAGRAPYEREPEPERYGDDPARPWKQAGRSWAAQARRLDVYYRTQGTVGDRLKSMFAPAGHPDVARLRARAALAARTARKLDRLSASGWVLLHDRRLVGTEETLDHVAIGPDGVTVIQSVEPEGTPPPGVPVAASVHVARVKLHELLPQIVQECSARLGEGWTALVYPLIVVNGSAPTVNEPPPIVRFQDAPLVLENHARSFSRMQVADLVMSLESAFPFASLGDPR